MLPSSFRLTAVTAICSLILFCSVTRAVDPAVLKEQNRRIAVINKVAPSVVAIFSPGGRGGGSGVLIDPAGYALTNFHVVRGAGTFMKCGLNNGKLYDAVVVGIDPTGDVALVKLLGRNDFPIAKLGDSDLLQPGDWTYAMGNPFLLANDFRPTVTYGIVSGTHRYQFPAGTFLEYTDCIQIDTSINPGNSGGPLFNEDGELVGINGRGSFEKRGRVNSGAGYAISINQIKHFMGHLHSGRVVDHGTLGATVSTESDGSVLVGNILEESSAYRRGLRIDDEIVSFAGRPIRSVNQFKNILGIYPKGWKLPLVYRADSQKYEIMVRLRGLHRKSELTPGRRPSPKPKPKTPDGKPKKPKGKPVPVRRRRPTAKPPEKYKHMYVKKTGFANYYFNQLEQKRTLRGLKNLGDFSKVTGRWILTGKTRKAGLPLSFILTNDQLALQIGNLPIVQNLGPDSVLRSDPPGSGGLLIAMHHLRLLLASGGRMFTEFYYLGTEPLDGTGPLVDVMTSTLTGVETHWYFNRQDGALLGFDTWLDPDADECVVRIQKFGEFDGRKLPTRMLVRHANQDYAILDIQSAKLSAGPKLVPAKSVPTKKTAIKIKPVADK